ncbi:CzcE family metal-binding protein [Duganella levis]|uniref:CzcE family metal-binding protein n=1 Tax=Duganella levis TaxID=2692169 RepID=A0ABW9VTX4_9BURK|nr:CzcE family metal-binding protein [Duganella levis]MYN25084.1 CzcE family metal-binding protein [Duganella levis]
MSQRIVITLALLFSVSVGAQAADQHFGSVLPAAAAGKVITITPQTRYVNVDNGDTVTFVRGGQTFTWNFRTLREADDFQLSSIAPAGFDTSGVQVYVDRDPTYR